MKKFKEFRVGDIFDGYIGKFVPPENRSNIKTDEFSVNLVTSKTTENGVQAYVRPGDYRSFRNCLSIAKDGAPGTVFYQDSEFSLGNVAMSMFFKESLPQLGKSHYMYLGIHVEKLAKSFSSYEKKVGWNLFEMNISIPVDENEEPDWSYMEEYIESIKKKFIESKIEYKDSLKEKLESLLENKQKYELEDVEFGEFVVKDTFDVSTGSLAPSDILSPGTIPRVTASSTNNGISGVYDYVTGLTYAEGIVTISFLGDSFYHKGKVSLEMKVHSLYNEKITDNSGLYISGVLSKFKKYYSYGNQLSSSKLKELKIELPITDENAPNWEYMDKYIHNIKIDKVNMIISELESEIETLSRL